MTTVEDRSFSNSMTGNCSNLTQRRQTMGCNAGELPRFAQAAQELAR
jgi:hypothetical protein